MSGYAFVSYSHLDAADYVERLAAHLAAAGVRVWFDKEVITGDRWARVIQQKIHECSAVIVVMTPAGDDSKWVSREISEAEDLHKPFFPLLLTGTRYFQLAEIQFEDVRSGAMPPLSYLSRLDSAISGTATAPSASRERHSETQAKEETASLRKRLDDLVERVPFARAAVVVSVDGLPMSASSGLARVDAEQIGVIATGLLALSRAASRNFDAGAVRTNIVELESAFLFVVAAGLEACLAVRADYDVDVGLAAYESFTLANWIRQNVSTAAS